MTTKCAMCNETLHSAYFRKGDSDKYCRHCFKKAFNGVYVFTYTLKKDGVILGNVYENPRMMEVYDGRRQ